jgi:wyosine [tRNA(Phe)-imidazoG37] synthetase (radical SAM superfamily)
MTSTLSTTNHDRDSAGLKYVYPVISRRAGGLSIGINFNTNNACNWRCVYCQVPNLSLGNAPDMDFALLDNELRFFLNDVIHGDFYQRFNMAENQRVIKDIAISGNGEPTSLKDFAQAIELIGNIATELGILPLSQFVLITNGSLIHLPKVQDGLTVLNRYGGEVWFKLDSATDEGRKRINHCAQSLQTSLKNLALSASLCPTKLQTIKREINLSSVMLYTLAREPLQPEAPELKKLSLNDLTAFSQKISALGFQVTVNA